VPGRPIRRSRRIWMITRYDDVAQAALCPEAFTSGRGASIPPITGRRTFPLLEQDDPDHAAFRRAVRGWFTRPRMSRLEGQIRQLVTRLLDAVIDDHRADLAPVVAEPVSSIVTAMLLGLPEPDWEWFRYASEASIRLNTSGDHAQAGTGRRGSSRCELRLHPGFPGGAGAMVSSQRSVRATPDTSNAARDFHRRRRPCDRASSSRRCPASPMRRCGPVGR
jgi:cytochrome P450